VVAKNLTELSATLNRVADKASVSVDKEMSAIREVTKKIDDTLVHVNAIAARIDAGEGTVGRLVNDETTIDRINSTVAKVDDTLGDITSMKMEVTYDGQMYFGSNPDEPDIGFTENPISGSMKNSLGVRVLPRDDYGYIIGFTGHPYGNLSEEEHLYPDSGGSYSEIVRTGDYRLTFQFMKRWGPAALRLGVKESSGGVGADLFLARDRVTLSADIYDWEFGSWPVLDGTPNLTLGARVNPWRHVYLGGGLDNVIFDARNGYATGYFGFGFWFTDSDLKWVMSALPLP
jgi:phospholipid/cholesterol/gamma-HCH transport system substrate-binding protein